MCVQHDAFCVAATVHTLLHGEYIELAAAKEDENAARRTWRPTTAVPDDMPRKRLWDGAFRALFNCPLPPERPDFAWLILEFQQVRGSPDKSHLSADRCEWSGDDCGSQEDVLNARRAVQELERAEKAEPGGLWRQMQEAQEIMQSWRAEQV